MLCFQARPVLITSSPNLHRHLLSLSLTLFHSDSDISIDSVYILDHNNTVAPFTNTDNTWRRTVDTATATSTSYPRSCRPPLSRWLCSSTSTYPLHNAPHQQSALPGQEDRPRGQSQLLALLIDQDLWPLALSTTSLPHRPRQADPENQGW